VARPPSPRDPNKIDPNPAVSIRDRRRWTDDTPLMIEKAVGVRVQARSRRLRRRHLNGRPQPLHAASPTYPAAPTVKSRGYAEMEDTTTVLPLLQPVSASAHALRSAGWRGRQACARDIFLGYRNGRSG
jgi:hypothetical protein